MLKISLNFDWLLHQRNLFLIAQLFDLGYEVTDYRTLSDLQQILQKLDDQMTLVLLREYIDESLVLLQRVLCWQLSDMVYIRRQFKDKENDMSSKMKVCIVVFPLYSVIQKI